MKNHEAKEVIDNAEQINQETADVDVKTTIDGEPVEEPKKKFWTKRKKIIAGVIVGTIAIAFGLKKLAEGMDFEGDPETFRQLTEDIIAESTGEIKDAVTNAA